MNDDPLKQTPAVELDRDNEASRWKRAHDVACSNLAELSSNRAKLLAALTQALLLLDQLLTEMRLANVTPSGSVVFSKAEFDRQMRILLGRQHNDPDETTGSGPRDRGGITG